MQAVLNVEAFHRQAVLDEDVVALHIEVADLQCHANRLIQPVDDIPFSDLLRSLDDAEIGECRLRRLILNNPATVLTFATISSSAILALMSLLPQ